MSRVLISPKSRVLYYPKYEPDLPWLRARLLLVDQVVRVIPDQAGYSPSEPFEELIEALRNAIDKRSPIPSDLEATSHELASLEAAFASIASRNHAIPNDPYGLHLLGGGLGLQNRVLLSNEKFGYEIARLLEFYNLVDRPVDHSHQQPGQYSKVHPEAAALIVSRLADKIGEREGMDTMTDHKLGFTTNALSPENLDPTGVLMSAIAQISIPLRVKYISTRDYAEVRESFKPVRDLFPLLVRELVQDYNLDRTRSPSILQERARQVAGELDSAISSYKRSEFGRNLGKWGFVTIAQLFTIPVALVAPSAACAMNSATAGFTLLDRQFAPMDATGRRAQFCRALSGARDRLTNVPCDRQVLTRLKKEHSRGKLNP